MCQFRGDLLEIVKESYEKQNADKENEDADRKKAGKQKLDVFDVRVFNKPGDEFFGRFALRSGFDERGGQKRFAFPISGQFV